MKRVGRRPARHDPHPGGARWARRPAVLVVAGVAALLLGGLAFLAGPPGFSPDRWAGLTAEELEAQAQQRPRDAGLHLALGTRYARRGDLSRAEAALERSRRLAPARVEPYAALGELARQRGADQRAAEMFAAAVERDPGFIEGYLHAANAFTHVQNYRRARPHAATYARRRPEDWRGPFLLGMISTGEGKMQEALAHYQEAIRRSPDHAPAYLNAAATYLFGPAAPQQLSAAAGYLERGLAISPDYAELHYYLGVIRCRQRRWPDAVASLQEAVRLKPALTEAYYPLAQALRRLGRREEAKLCLELYTRQRARATARVQRG